MKRTVVVITVIIILASSLSGCNTARFTDEERFAARANVAINYNIWKYLPESVDYAFSSLEFYEVNDARIIRADCSVRLAGDIYVKSVFLLSDKQWYLIDFLMDNTVDDGDAEPLFDEDMKLWYINLGDFDFTPDENNFVDRANARTLANMFLNTGDKTLLGMQ